MGGTQIADTEDWYDQVLQLYPESLDNLKSRYKWVGEYYKSKHRKNEGKSIAYFIATHADLVGKLPLEFGGEKHVNAGYCASFEVILKNDEDPVVIKKVSNEYI